jgi:predicted metalloprotease
LIQKGRLQKVRWGSLRESSNVEDRRGIGGLAIGGGAGGIVILVLALLFGVDPRNLLDQGQTDPGAGRQVTQQSGQREDDLKRFVSAVLGSTEDVWADIFRRSGETYRPPKLVLFTDQVRSPCGIAGAAVGPFYCPEDQKVYLDESFFHDLQSKFRAPGDFAAAYVIAHEVGHHVQNLMGTMDKVHPLQGRVSREQANQLSVRLELQADFLAGVWAHYAEKKGIVEPGDIEEAMRAASAVGDDRLQKQGQGYVVPDSFTHGTSEQRVRWFRKGYQTGDVSQGDTFSASSL